MNMETPMQGLELSEAEIRVLGCLIEKQITTPDYYPLTLNAVRTACNQRSNREPVVNYDDREVIRALDDLRSKKLAWMVNSTGARVSKYEHNLEEAFALPISQMALLGMLLLRGPQTAGELKTRSERMHTFATVAEVEYDLQQLIARPETPLVSKLPLQPGRREPRYAHLLGPVPESEPPGATLQPEPARVQLEQEEERFAAIEAELAELRAQCAALKEEFRQFKEQFE